MAENSSLSDITSATENSATQVVWIKVGAVDAAALGPFKK